MDGTFNGQSIPSGVMRSSLVRASSTIGYILGLEETKVGLSLGPCVQFLLGGVDTPVYLVQGGGYGQISIQKPFTEDWLLFVGNGWKQEVLGSA